MSPAPPQHRAAPRLPGCALTNPQEAGPPAPRQLLGMGGLRHGVYSWACSVCSEPRGLSSWSEVRSERRARPPPLLKHGAGPSSSLSLKPCRVNLSLSCSGALCSWSVFSPRSRSVASLGVGPTEEPGGVFLMNVTFLAESFLPGFGSASRPSPPPPPPAPLPAVTGAALQVGLPVRLPWTPGGKAAGGEGRGCVCVAVNCLNHCFLLAVPETVSLSTLRQGLWLSEQPDVVGPDLVCSRGSATADRSKSGIFPEECPETGQSEKAIRGQSPEPGVAAPLGPPVEAFRLRRHLGARGAPRTTRWEPRVRTAKPALTLWTLPEFGTNRRKL